MGKFTKKNAAKMGRKGADARWHKKPEQKNHRQAATHESSVRLNDGDKNNAPNAVGAPAPAGFQETRPMASQDPARPVPAPEALTPPARPPELAQKPKRLAPLLCPHCRRLGYANCPECMLATDSSLALDGDVIFRVRLPTAQDLWPWHRCKRCDNSFKAPQYPALSFCPDCVAMDSGQPTQHPSSGEPP
jgi:hypothetical protein